MKNPKVGPSTWSNKKIENAKAFEVKQSLEFEHPCDQSWSQFMATPLSTPVWTLIMKLDIPPTAEVFTKWWKKIKSDTRFDAWKKLARYLQCLRYFNQASDAFWAQIGTNITYWSIQKIATELTFQANWLKASGMDLKDVQNAYYEVASELTQGDPTVKQVTKCLEKLWPAGFRPFNLHYDGEPYSSTILFALEDATLCRKIVKPKGLKIPDSFFANLDESDTEAKADRVPEQVKPD